MSQVIGATRATRDAAPAAGVGGAPPRPRPRPTHNVTGSGWTLLAVMLALIGALSPLALRDGGPSADERMPGALPIPGGELRINDLRDAPDHGQMPGMMMIDPIPDGFRGFVIEATIVSFGPESARFDGRDYLVTATGIGPLAPSRSAPGPAVIPAGASVTVQLLYVVPKSTVDLRLGHRGRPETVAVEALPPTASPPGAASH